MKSIQFLSAAFILSQKCHLSTARSLLRRRDNDNTTVATNTTINHQSNRALDTRIINGNMAPKNRYTYAVSLQDSIGHFCGGSLIAKDVVLTAAHCKGGTYNVVLGRHNWNDNDGQVIARKSDLPHPEYNARSTNNDFMLVFLERAATINGNVGVVSLNSQNSIPSIDQRVTVMGWGDTDSSNLISDPSDVLMNVNVNVLSNTECDDSEGTINGYNDNYNDQITENMLCARANLRDSCQGDSGGPLVIKGGNAGADVQVGVVSWGVGCASPDFPGVYARVSRAYDWIESEVCDGSGYAAEAGFDCSERVSNDGLLLNP